jgi:hypothetical protein
VINLHFKYVALPLFFSHTTLWTVSLLP